MRGDHPGTHAELRPQIGIDNQEPRAKQRGSRLRRLLPLNGVCGEDHAGKIEGAADGGGRGLGRQAWRKAEVSAQRRVEENGKVDERSELRRMASAKRKKLSKRSRKK